MQISSRVPSMIAMTAQSLDTVSHGRFLLGLGVSGPQVVEGLHGANFAQPLSRLKECIAVIKKGLKGDRVEYDGKHYLLPRPGGEGKPIRLSQPPRPNLPLYLATLGPKSLELTGEVAQGWLGTSFIPEHADIFLEPMAKGAAKSGRTLADIDIQIGASFELGDHVEEMIEARRPALAFTWVLWALPRQIFTTTHSSVQVMKKQPSKFSNSGWQATNPRRSSECLMKWYSKQISLAPRR